jgi:PAS domain S-box-containing protein
MRLSPAADPCPPLSLDEMSAALLRVLVEADGSLGHALTDAQGRLVWVSPGFERTCGKAGGLIGQAAATVFGHADDEQLRWLQAPPRPRTESRVLRCWRGPAARGWLRVSYRALDAAGDARAQGLLTIDDASAPPAAVPTSPARTAADELVRLTLLLEVAQKFGGLGVWDHDPRTGAGHWDRHVWRFFGIDAESDTPSPELALTRVHPQDVELLTDLYAPLHPGGYTRRFRVLHRDGSTHSLQAQFIVEGDVHGAPSRVFGVMRDDTQALETTASLQIAHEQLHLALDLANLAIWRHDLRSDRLVQSEQGWRMLGLAPPAEPPTARAMAQHVHPDDLQRLVESGRMARRTGQPHETTARFRRHDGSWCHTLVRRVLQRDETGQPLAFLGVTLDVTAQVEESQRMLQSEHRLALATEAAGVAMWEVDLGDGRVSWNRQMHQLHGTAPGRPLPDFSEWVERHVHPLDREAVLAQGIQLLQQRRGHMESQCRIVRGDGGVRWVVHRCRVEPRNDSSVLLGILTDVTIVVETQSRLAAATERAALATRCAGIGTWEHDLGTGEAIWDEQMFLLRGLAPGPRALGPEQRLALVHPDDVAVVQAQLQAAATTGSACMYEFRVRLPDGRWRRLASRSVVLRDKDGRLTRQVGVNWDVTQAGLAPGQP